jgi:hypothetical protein
MRFVLGRSFREDLGWGLLKIPMLDMLYRLGFVRIGSYAETEAVGHLLGSSADR